MLVSTVSTPFDAEYQTIYLNRLKEIKDAFLFLFPKKTKTKNTALYVSQLPSPCIMFPAELTRANIIFPKKKGYYGVSIMADSIFSMNAGTYHCHCLQGEFLLLLLVTSS